MSKLTSEAVNALALECLFREGEPTQDAIKVDGIIGRFAFHPGRIAKNANAIGALLAELPDEFHATRGGGWSFLNACMNRSGVQWGEHFDMEALFCLGIAAGKAKWQLPRDLWDALPGGMPYVVVMDAPTAQSPALKRLIDEVRVEQKRPPPGGGYNRTHNRHNRS